MNNVTVKMKLTLLSLMASLGIILIGIFVFSRLESIIDRVEKASLSNKIVKELMEVRISEKNYQLRRDQASLDAHEGNISLLKQETVKLQNEFHDSENLAEVKKIQDNVAVYESDFANYVKNNAVQNNQSNLDSQAAKLKEYGRAIEEAADALQKRQLDERESLLSGTKTILIILSFVVIFLIGLVAFVLIKSIIGAMSKVENGLLSFFRFLNRETNKVELIDLKSEDEFGQMAKIINEKIIQLETVFKKDAHATEDINRIVEMLGYGFVSVRITTNAGSKELQSTINGLNKALEELEKSTGEVSSTLAAFGMSDFTTSISIGKYSGEVGGMLTSLQGLSESMGDFMALLSKNGVALNQGASRMSTASNNLSSSSNTQASSLEETAAAIEELTSNISANSQKASEMASLAQETQKAANEGKLLADNTVTSMNEISEATNAINDAVAIIENIAFQTNILSLNAAVEAATAGDAGKGFAVVAQEVRNLANRSADAAKEIKNLAILANTKSGDGLKISQDMMKGFEVINQKISTTTELVQDVANGSREQMEGINQINMAVTQLDQMTQQNAQSAGEVNELSENMLAMSDSLTNTAAKTRYQKESENRVCRIDMMFETNKLKFDHVTFKNSNFAKLKDTKTSWTVTNESQCNLGKWIQSHSSENYATGVEWNELLASHTHVHQKTQEYINREKANASAKELAHIAQEIEYDTSKVFVSLNRVRTNACIKDGGVISTQQTQHNPKRVVPHTANKPVPKSNKQLTHKSDDVWESF